MPICPSCGRYVTRMEDWAPYRWLWEATLGRPWTHALREHPAKFSAAIVIVFLAAVLGKGRWWSAPLAFSAGLLAGHVLW